MNTVIKRLLKLYTCFAVLNVAYKILVPWYQRYRVKKLWKHLKGEDPDVFARSLRKFGSRIPEFFIQPGLNHPNEDLVKVAAPRPMLSCNTERSIKWMLKDEFHNITKAGPNIEIWRLLREFLGPDGIFVLRHGESHPKLDKKWFNQRKVASLIFTKSNFMTTFYETFVKKSKIFIKKLEKENGKIIDLQSLFFSFTMDSIEKFFMGTEVNTIEGGMSEYAKNFDNAHHAMLTTLFRNFQFMIMSKFFLPFPFGTFGLESEAWNSLLIKFIYYLTPSFKIFNESISKLDDHVYKYIKKTRVDPNLKNRKDVIANFLNSKMGKDLSDKSLRDIVLNLTIAGRDTTACALSWLFFELMKNEEAQKKLQDEIDTKLDGRIPVLKDLEAESMPYLNGAIYEALRLHPPVPYDTKVTEKETTYLDGTVIPAKTALIFAPQAVGRNPDKFPEPDAFKPERWIPFVQPSLYEFPIFQAGPRFCLGKDMAQLEMKLLTVMLLQKFSFKIKPGELDRVTYTLMLTQSITTDDDTREPSPLLAIPHRR